MSNSSIKVLVLGAGVSGLTCALALAREGFDVSIWAKDKPESTTSAVAAAYWAPYLCQPLEKVIAWSKYTKKYMEESIMQQKDSGVRPVELIQFFDNEKEVPWWRDAVQEFDFVNETELPDGYKSGFKTMLLLIDSSKYLPWLVAQLENLGVQIKQKIITDFSDIDNSFDAVINCTGLGSRELCKDNHIFPVRGQVVLAETNSLNAVLADDDAHNKLTYLIPRYDDLVIGGSAQPNDWNLEVDPQETKEILHRASLLYPQLGQAKVLKEKVGLRPSRDEVRLEFEAIDGKRIIHNYGHGGAGYTLSWGCAVEVVKLVKAHLNKLQS